MPTDVKLDQGGGNVLVLQAAAVKAEASDLMLDQPLRRRGGGPHRRALVHDQNDGLTINFNGDYPGGVTINNVAAISPKAGTVNPTLLIKGGISYENKTFNLDGSRGVVIVNVEDELNTLRGLINTLTAKVAALEARP